VSEPAFQEPTIYSPLGKLYTLDVSPCHIHTCPNPLIIVGHDPMTAGEQDQVLCLLGPGYEISVPD